MYFTTIPPYPCDRCGVLVYINTEPAHEVKMCERCFNSEKAVSSDEFAMTIPVPELSDLPLETAR